MRPMEREDEPVRTLPRWAVKADAAEAKRRRPAAAVLVAIMAGGCDCEHREIPVLRGCLLHGPARPKGRGARAADDVAKWLTLYE